VDAVRIIATSTASASGAQGYLSLYDWTQGVNDLNGQSLSNADYQLYAPSTNNPFKQWPFNGSFWDKPFKDQDDKCSAGPVAGLWMDNHGMLSACQWHDNQYTKFQCNFSSFLPLIPGPCTVANIVLGVWLAGDGLKLLF
jgi:hypothetical protein